MAHELRRLPGYNDGTVSYIDYTNKTGTTLAPHGAEYKSALSEAADNIGVTPAQIEANLAEGRWEVW